MALWNPPDVAVTPTGVVLAYGGTSAPVGYLLLNGDTVGKSGSGAIHESEDYRMLFDLWKHLPPNLGTEDFDAGNVVTLSDARGAFILGKAVAGTGSAIGSTGGAIDHTHGLGTLTTGTEQGGVAWELDPKSGGPVFRQNHYHTGAGSTAAANPPFLALNWIVKI